MDWIEAARLDFAQTQNHKVAWLASDANPNVDGPNGRDAYRRMLVERYSAPSLARRFATAAGAAGRAIAAAAAGDDVFVDEAERSRRMTICVACESFDATSQRCKLCTCYLPLKTRLATEAGQCPAGKW